MVIIVMGVSGCGKTTVGKRLSKKTGLPFFDADDFHPSENVRKMKSGQPLNDDDRHPWLENLSAKISEWNRSGGAILACSALKKTYREILSSGEGETEFVYLKGSKSVIFDRMKKRDGHYMPPELLDSQFETLEEPEEALTVSINQSPEIIVHEIVNHPKLLHLT